MTLRIGDTAPDFTLYSSDKRPVQLHSLRGQNVLLLFFPLAFTNTCTKEMCLMRDTMKDYEQLHATVLGISVDSPQTLARYREDLKLNFTLLSDFNKEVSQLYDVLYEIFSVGLRGVSKRAAFLIDGNGIIQHLEILENAGKLPDFEAIRAVLTTLN